jgi:hypothetical protein
MQNHFETAVVRLNEAMASGYGNVPAKRLVAEHALATALQNTPLNNVYLDIYEACFPRGKPANIDLLRELATGGTQRRTSRRVSIYWEKALAVDLGL